MQLSLEPPASLVVPGSTLKNGKYSMTMRLVSSNNESYSTHIIIDDSKATHRYFFHVGPTPTEKTVFFVASEKDVEITMPDAIIESIVIEREIDE